MLPLAVTAQVVVEQVSTFGWERYIGTSGHIIGRRTFGTSAPLKEHQRKFRCEPDQVVASAKLQPSAPAVLPEDPERIEIASGAGGNARAPIEFDAHISPQTGLEYR